LTVACVDGRVESMSRVNYKPGMEIHSGVIYTFDPADVPHYVLDQITGDVVTRHEDRGGAERAVVRGQYIVSITDYQAR
jgi:hypothetical protein